MLAYSPYDNVSRQAYPAMLVTTSLWDSQVQYYEPAKWVARLRTMKTDSNPLLFRITMEAGHGGKSGRFERYRQTAEEFGFVVVGDEYLEDDIPHMKMTRAATRPNSRPPARGPVA